MALLPARNILDGTALPVTSQMKTALGSLRDYLSDLLGGDSGNKATARAALGAAASGANADLTSVGAVTGVTAAVGDNTTKLATTAHVMALQRLGHGQTWQSQTRTNGVTYTNLTGAPIVFMATFSTAGTSSVAITIGGVAMPVETSQPNIQKTVSWIIPTGLSYSMVFANLGSLTSALELR